MPYTSLGNPRRPHSTVSRSTGCQRSSQKSVTRSVIKEDLPGIIVAVTNDLRQEGDKGHIGPFVTTVLIPSRDRLRSTRFKPIIWWPV